MSLGRDLSWTGRQQLHGTRRSCGVREATEVREWKYRHGNAALENQQQGTWRSTV